MAAVSSSTAAAADILTAAFCARKRKSRHGRKQPSPSGRRKRTDEQVAEAEAHAELLATAGRNARRRDRARRQKRSACAVGNEKYDQSEVRQQTRAEELRSHRAALYEALDTNNEAMTRECASKLSKDAYDSVCEAFAFAQID
jgi:hypothetical protein